MTINNCIKVLFRAPGSFCSKLHAYALLFLYPHEVNRVVIYNIRKGYIKEALKQIRVIADVKAFSGNTEDDNMSIHSQWNWQHITMPEL